MYTTMTSFLQFSKVNEIIKNQTQIVYDPFESRNYCLLQENPPLKIVSSLA